MATFRHDWVTRNVPHLEQWFHGKRFLRGLEVGSFEGRSACWCLEHLCDTLVCVDTWNDDSHGEGAALLRGAEALFDENTSHFASRCIKRKGDSKVTLARMLTQGRTFDFTYIDGDHEASSVITDAALAWAMLEPGGCIVFDDYDWPQPECKVCPTVGINAFLACFAAEIGQCDFSPPISWQGYAIKQVRCLKG